MSKKYDGGPAFPLKEPLSGDSEGMTLRDYFAAEAMQSFLMHSAAPWDIVAGWAYEVADAMLKARNQQGEQQ